MRVEKKYFDEKSMGTAHEKLIRGEFHYAYM